MTTVKYKILRKIYRSTPTAPIFRTAFYKRAKTIVQRKKHIDDLIGLALLKELPGGRLEITPAGVAAMEHEQERREDIRRLYIQFWISATISVAALVVSILAITR